MYETIDDDELSYIKLVNMQSKVVCNRIHGSMAHLLTPFLMSIHVVYVKMLRFILVPPLRSTACFVTLPTAIAPSTCAARATRSLSSRCYRRGSAEARLATA